MSHCRLWIVRLLSVRLLCGVLALFIYPAYAQRSLQSRQPPTRPSIILIVADSIGYGDLGCYGQKQIQTTNLDNLAAEGMRFTSFYSGGAQVVPSSASLLLGKNTGHIDIRGDRGLPLQSGDVTLPEILKSAQFATGAFGHWGLGTEGSSGVPDRKGFDQWFGFFDETFADNYYPTLLYRGDPSHGETIRELTDNLDNKHGEYADDYFTKAATNFIRIYGPERAFSDRCYFLYLPYTIARANRDLATRTGNGMQVPDIGPYGNQSWPPPELNKAAMITRLDGYIGDIMKRLKALKNDDDTVIIFTSSNGPHSEGGVDSKFFHSSGSLRGGKGDLYEGGIRVPFIVRWPGKIRAGSTSDFPSAFWDVMPTVAEMAKVLTPANLDGISLLPTLLGKSQTNRHEFLYWETHDHGFKQAVRMGDWKAVRAGVDGALELYNLKTDASEKTDVAAKNPQIIARISEYLKTARIEDKNWPAMTADGKVVSDSH